MGHGGGESGLKEALRAPETSLKQADCSGVSTSGSHHGSSMVLAPVCYRRYVPGRVLGVMFWVSDVLLRVPGPQDIFNNFKRTRKIV